MNSYSNNLHHAIAVMLALLIILSCSKHENTDGGPLGKLELNMGVSVAVYDVYNQVKAANPDEFSVEIYSGTGELFISYANSTEMPDLIDLPVGIYYAEAHSENDLPAAFENDYYYGATSSFEILAGQTQIVSLNCSLANIMVSVIYSQTVIDEFTDFSTTVSNPNGSLVFARNETRPGFFDEGPLNIEANLYYPDGTGGSLVKSLTYRIDNAEHGKHYEIHIDASVPGGGAVINLSVDESYETEVVSLNDALIEGPIGYGDLLITEIMYNPALLGDTEGEFIEVVNNSVADINLNQVVIVRVNGDDRHTINTDVVLSPGDYAVLGRTLTASDNVDYSYGSAITLPNTGEILQLANYGTDGTNGSVICGVDYGAANFITGLSGVSLQLSNDVSSVGEILDGLNWCESTQAYSTGDLGTPGLANYVCP